MTVKPFTEREWNEVVHLARQARTFRAYEAAGRRVGNVPQALGMACSARNYERDVRAVARRSVPR